MSGLDCENEITGYESTDNPNPNIEEPSNMPSTPDRFEIAEERAHKALIILNEKDREVEEMGDKLKYLEEITRNVSVVNSCSQLSGISYTREVTDICHHSPNLRKIQGLPENAPPGSSLSTTSFNFEQNYISECPNNDVLPEQFSCQELLRTVQICNQEILSVITYENCLREREHSMFAIVAEKLCDILHEFQKGKEETQSIKQASSYGGDTEPKQNGYDHEKSCGDIRGKSNLKTANSAPQLKTIERNYFSSSGGKNNEDYSSASGNFYDNSAKSYDECKPRKHSKLNSFSTSTKICGKKTVFKYKRICNQFMKQKKELHKLMSAVQIMEKNNRILLEKIENSELEKKKILEENEKSKGIIRDFNEKKEVLFGSAKPDSEKVRNRLLSACQTMKSQRKQMENLDKLLKKKEDEFRCLNSKLLRCESISTNRMNIIEKLKVNMDKYEKDLIEQNEKNKCLLDEVNNFKSLLLQHKRMIITLRQHNDQLQKNNLEGRRFMNDHISGLEKKVQILRAQISVKEQGLEDMLKQIEDRFLRAKYQLSKQIDKASTKIVRGDQKIRELYNSLEKFLRITYESHYGLRPRKVHSRAHNEAVKVASEILNVTPGEILQLLANSQDTMKLKQWIKTCNSMIYKEKFANELSQFLYDVSNETRPNILENQVNKLTSSSDEQVSQTEEFPKASLRRRLSDMAKVSKEFKKVPIPPKRNK